MFYTWIGNTDLQCKKIFWASPIVKKSPKSWPIVQYCSQCSLSLRECLFSFTGDKKNTAEEDDIIWSGYQPVYVFEKTPWSIKVLKFLVFWLFGCFKHEDLALAMLLVSQISQKVFPEKETQKSLSFLACFFFFHLFHVFSLSLAGILKFSSTYFTFLCWFLCFSPLHFTRNFQKRPEIQLHFIFYVYMHNFSEDFWWDLKRNAWTLYRACEVWLPFMSWLLTSYNFSHRKLTYLFKWSHIIYQ
jgi:hypothetical protein